MRFLWRSFPLLFLLLSVMFNIGANECYASVAPFWLREGAYACYEFSSCFECLNGSEFYARGSYYWKCLGITGKTAVLEVTFNFTGREPAQFEINIDVETREAFSNGESLGIVPYLIPTDVNKTDVIDDYMSMGNCTYPATVGGVSPNIETPYKTFSGDELWAVHNQYEQDQCFVHFHEKDSGLIVICYELDNVWRQKMGIIHDFGTGDPKYDLGFLYLKDANIEFMPEPTSPLTLLQPYILIAAIATAATILIYYFKIRKGKLPSPTKTTRN